MKTVAPRLALLLARTMLLVGTMLLTPVGIAWAYPIDAGPETGIPRLEAGRLALEGKVSGVPTLPSGGQLPVESIRLRLADRPDFQVPEPDAAFSASLTKILGSDARASGLAVLDLSDPDHPVYGEHNAGQKLNPGSVGKVVAAAGILQTLADLYPDDLDARRRVLRESTVVADEFIVSDSHTVPLWSPGQARVTRRPLHRGDAANLWTYLDWMMSASSNAAAAMVMRESVVLAHFGLAYPVPTAEGTAYLATAPKTELGERLAEVLQTTLTRNGIDLEGFRQGSVFTAQGKRRIPGTSSHGTSREMLRFLVRMEQGRMVDPFSSLELKRLLYMTERRIRYASAPALADAAVFFKSGSLYKCAPEPDFVCKKYHGNVHNYMNSIAIVEAPASAPRLHYLVALTSNVLRVNSAVAHQTLATRLHRLLESRHPAAAP